MKYSKYIVLTAGLAVAAVVGYSFGQSVERRARSSQDERQAVEKISNVVGTIYLLDMNDVSGARRVLLGLASSSVDDVIASWEPEGHVESEYGVDRCRVLTRLRDLRAKHNFLRNPEDEVLRSDPEIASAEARRRAFLDSVRCDAPEGSAAR